MRRLAAIVLVLAAVAGRWPAESAEPVISEEAVKAAFLFRFADYVEWPQGAHAPGTRIAVLRAPGVAAELRRILAARSGQNEPVQVREVSRLDELDDAQIVFVGRGQEVAIERLAKRYPERAFLLVADSPGALGRGAMINFVLNEKRVRFEVSLPAAESAQLKLSSRLLAVAYRVQRSQQSEN
jgi:hypothetical protein